MLIPTSTLRVRWPGLASFIHRGAAAAMLIAIAVLAGCTDDPPSAPNVSARRPHADVVGTGGPQIDGGAYGSCGIRTDARVLCWGSNGGGQTSVPTGLHATQVSAGYYHACAVEPDGTVTCWGARPSDPNSSWMDHGQAGVPFGLSGVTQVSASVYFTCALRANGTVTCWGDDVLGGFTFPAGITALAAGWAQVCGLMGTGGVICAGYGGGLGFLPVNGATQVAAGDWHVCVLKSDGTVACWGDAAYGQTTVPANLTGVVRISAGGNSTCALESDGTVTCWGQNNYGQATPPAGLQNVIQITVGETHACALKADLSAVCWGYPTGTIPSLINRPPTIAFNTAVTWWEGVAANVPATVQDPDGDALTYAWTVNGQSVTQTTPGPTLTRTFADDGWYSVALTVSDGQFSASSSIRVGILDGPAKFGAITAPTAPVAAGAPIAISGPFTDLGKLDTHTAFIRWGAGAAFTPITVTESNGDGAFSSSRSDVAPGVYQLTVRVTDNGGAVADSTLPDFLVVYDASGSYVTGKGAIQSPAGACQLTCYGAEGRATFGFTSRYENGATLPTGTTQFQFKAGNLDFQSTSYQWLVVSGPRAQFKGEGRINGGGSYGFLLTAIDGDLVGGGGSDKFRIKIWDKSSGLVVYDNQIGAADSADPTTVIASGSISIKK
jgi:hypothetical protein